MSRILAKCRLQGTGFDTVLDPHPKLEDLDRLADVIFWHEGDEYRQLIADWAAAQAADAS